MEDLSNLPPIRKGSPGPVADQPLKELKAVMGEYFENSERDDIIHDMLEHNMEPYI